MREILFKAKRLDNGAWVEGSLITYKDGTAFICCEDYIPDVLNKYEVDPSTVCQYTGLTDKNGKKIFDGDVVRRETDYYGKHKVYDEPVVWEDDIEKGFWENRTQADIAFTAVIGKSSVPSTTGRGAIMLKLKNCPHCGGEVMLCKLNTMVSVAEFSIVCTECGLETRIYANPMANCCFDMGEAVRSITEKWNRRDGEGGQHEGGRQ